MSGKASMWLYLTHGELLATLSQMPWYVREMFIALTLYAVAPHPFLDTHEILR